MNKKILGVSALVAALGLAACSTQTTENAAVNPTEANIEAAAALPAGSIDTAAGNQAVVAVVPSSAFGGNTQGGLLGAAGDMSSFTASQVVTVDGSSVLGSTGVYTYFKSGAPVLDGVFSSNGSDSTAFAGYAMSVNENNTNATFGVLKPSVGQTMTAKVNYAFAGKKYVASFTATGK